MFERDNRTGSSGFPLWRMDFGGTARDVRDARSKRRLIVEPYAMVQSAYPPELRVFLEEDVPQYCYIVKSITDKPKGAPTFRIEPTAIEASRRTVPAKTGLEYIVIEALATQQLTSDSAKRALHNLFWTYFVLDDDGLTWLCKHTSKEVGNFYADQRLTEYVRAHDIDKRGTYKARRVVEDVMQHDSELGGRMQRRVVEDEAFQHAIEALLLTNDCDETKSVNVLRMIELHATDKDHAFAGIVSASRASSALRGHGLRGLRACQRAERDPEFLQAIAEIARAERTPSLRDKRINTFLHASSRLQQQDAPHDDHSPQEEQL